MNRTKLASVAAAALTALALGACGTSGAASDEATGSNRPAENAGSTSSPASPSPSKSKDDELAFGKTYTYDDGLSVTIGKPKPFKRSEWASGGEGAKATVLFDVTVVNKTGKKFDAALFYATLQSANEEAEQVFDDQAKLLGAPSTKLLNGREAKFRMGFGVADPKDLVLEVNPDPVTYAPVIWTNAKG